MSIRSVFIAKETYPYYEEVQVEFDWFGGFALSQKRKCQIGLHKNFLTRYPDKKILEVSEASMMSLGAKLSAMNLSKRVDGGITSVESAFQSSRIYKNGAKTVGPFPEYMFLPGKECKKIVKKLSEGMISYEYFFEGMTFYAPPYHISLFYDYLYLNALLEPENNAVREQLLKGGFDAFSDLATKSLNCQARSAAIFVGLVRAGLIDKVRSYESYLDLFRTEKDGKPKGQNAYENVPMLYKNKNISSLIYIPCTVDRDAVERYYESCCSGLTNKKEGNNYLDLCG